MEVIKNLPCKFEPNTCGKLIISRRVDFVRVVSAMSLENRSICQSKDHQQRNDSVKYFAEVAYLGTRYHGWQSQNNAHSVQQAIENALRTVLQEEVKITGSGRTDAGVHAYQQFFHFESDTRHAAEKLMYKLNAVLEDDIAIRSVRKVVPEAHARYTATRRSYIYRICPHKDPFSRGQSYQLYKKLDVAQMNAAAALLPGEKDFTSFSKVKTNVNNFFCNVFSAHWLEDKENGNLEFHISANRFLRGMVRAIVGTLLLVGEEKITTGEFEAILAAHDRKKAGRSAPAAGLFLSEVAYPEHIFIK